MKKIKILYISPTIPFYGAERSLFDLVKYLDTERFLPILLVQNGCSYKEYFQNIGVEVYEMDINIKFTPKNFFRIMKLNFKLIKFVIINKVSLVHINLIGYLESLMAFVFLIKILNIHLIFHLRSHYVFSALERFILLNGRVICVSKAIQKQFLVKRRSDFFTKPSINKVITIYNGRDLTKFLNTDNALETKKGLDLNDEIIVGMVSSIDKRKRIDLFLLVANEIKKQGLNVKFLIIGDIYVDSEENILYKQEIMTMCEKLGLKNDVIFTGFREDIPKILKIIDVFILTSKRDPFPGVIIEAMASGKSVVGSAVDGIVELIDNGKTGFLIDSDNPSDYADKILFLIKNNENRTIMGENGKKRAIELFEIKTHVQRVEELYINSFQNN